MQLLYWRDYGLRGVWIECGGDMMQSEREQLLTTGQVAKRTGITTRTLRYYDQIELLKPTKQNTAQVRLYSKEDLHRLQKIQTLKYMGLPLEEIKSIIQNASGTEQDIRQSLMLQKNVIWRNASHFHFAVKAIKEAMSIAERKEELDWNKLAGHINAIASEKDWIEQYQTSARLQARMELYHRFSLNKQGWHSWFFDQLDLRRNLRILELGCGDGSLWKSNLERVPETWKITLTDLSGGMLDEARNRIGESDPRFKFLIADIQSIPFHDGEFDIVIANHMLYHVRDIPKALSEVRRIMRKDAFFFASTMGKGHLKEIEELAQDFDRKIRVLDPVMERFHLGNGENLLKRFFSDNQIHLFEDQLIVDEAQPIIDYMISTPMNAKEILTGARLKQFKAFLQRKLDREERITVSKELGCFRSQK